MTDPAPNLLAGGLDPTSLRGAICPANPETAFSLLSPVKLPAAGDTGASPLLPAVDAPMDPITAYQALQKSGAALSYSDRLARALVLALASWPPEDALELQKRTSVTITRYSEQFVYAVLGSYSDLILGELHSIVHFAGKVGDALLAAPSLVDCLTKYTLQSVADMILTLADPPGWNGRPSELADFCPQVKAIVAKWDAVKDFFETLKKLGPSGVADFFEELLLAVAGMLSQPKLKIALFAFADDPVALGRLLGTAVGIAMWLVIDIVVTRGFGTLGSLSPLAKALAVVGETTWSLGQ